MGCVGVKGKGVINFLWRVVGGEGDYENRFGMWGGYVFGFIS